MNTKAEVEEYQIGQLYELPNGVLQPILIRKEEE